MIWRSWSILENRYMRQGWHERSRGNISTYDLTEENSKLHKEFLVTEDGRVFYWRTLLDKIELVDDEIPEGMVEGLQEGDTYRHFNAIWVVDKIYTVDDPTLWYKLRIKSHVIKKSPMYKGIGTMDCAYSRGA